MIQNKAPTLHGVFKGGMQIVDDLGEDICGPLVAIFIQNVQSQSPFPHGEIGHGRWLITVAYRQHQRTAILGKIR